MSHFPIEKANKSYLTLRNVSNFNFTHADSLWVWFIIVLYTKMHTMKLFGGYVELVCVQWMPWEIWIWFLILCSLCGIISMLLPIFCEYKMTTTLNQSYFVKYNCQFMYWNLLLCDRFGWAFPLVEKVNLGL